MSLTKSNFDNEFRDQTIENAEFKESQEQQEEKIFENLENCVAACNKIKCVGITGAMLKMPNKYHTKKARLKGRYRGMIYTESHKVFRQIILTIEAHGFNVYQHFFLEEMDENFTNISFIIKKH